jgi:hypothetical protein
VLLFYAVEAHFCTSTTYLSYVLCIFYSLRYQAASRFTLLMPDFYLNNICSHDSQFNSAEILFAFAFKKTTGPLARHT